MNAESEARAQQWVRWLDAGIELRVPSVSVPYCDTLRSTFESLGFGRYARMDEWTAFEAGHGQYGGTERTEFSTDELLRYLAPLATRAAHEVEPWTWMRNAGPHEPAASVLDRVRRQEIALVRWYGRDDSGQHSTVVGDGANVYWVRRRGAVVTRVERLDPELVSSLESLPIHRDAIAPRTGEHDALVERVARHERELDRVLGALDRDRSLAFRDAQRGQGLAQGARVGWRHFWDANTSSLMLVTPSRALAKTLISWALLTDAGWSVQPLEPALLARLSAREGELCALLDELRSMRVAYTANTNIACWRVWHEGKGYEVEMESVGLPAIPRSVRELWPVEIPVMDCAMKLANVLSGDRFAVIEERTRVAILALIEALPR